MITRPLDLASRLRQPPGPLSGLALYMVNVVLLGLFFVLFGSRFVLSPGLPVDFSLPSMPGAYSGAAPTSMVIAIKDTDFIITEDGLMNLAQLRVWLAARASDRPGAQLLIHADVSVPLLDLIAVAASAREAGLQSQFQLAAEPASTLSR